MNLLYNTNYINFSILINIIYYIILLILFIKKPYIRLYYTN